MDGKYLRRRLCRACCAACERRPTRRCPSWSSWDKAACAVDVAGGPSHSIAIALRGSTCATLHCERERRKFARIGGRTLIHLCRPTKITICFLTSEFRPQMKFVFFLYGLITESLNIFLFLCLQKRWVFHSQSYDDGWPELFFAF